MKLLTLLEAKHKNKKRYGCAMIFYDFPDIKDIHKLIDKDDLYIDPDDDSFGLEKDPHCTLLFGFHASVKFDVIKDTVDKYHFDNFIAHNASLFENEKFDVLKFDIKGDNLKECNKELSKLPHTNEYKDYHPHNTVAYLLPGKGKKYVKLLKDKEYKLKPTKGVYSEQSGKKTNIKLKYMNDLFVPIDIAKRLRVIGYEEPCIACYDGADMLATYYSTFNPVNYNLGGSSKTSAPIYMQVIEWLQTKHDIHVCPVPKRCYPDNAVTGQYYLELYHDTKLYETDDIFTYKEAIIFGIEQAIKILKKEKLNVYLLDWLKVL